MEETKNQDEDETQQALKMTQNFLEWLAMAETLPQSSSSYDFFSGLVGRAISVENISAGHVTCSIIVKPYLANFYYGLHGGAVAAVAERLATACARTVVAEDKDVVLGELSISYLSAAPVNAELIADASLLKTGRNLSVVALEFKLKPDAKLVYTAQATFFHLPASRL